VKCCGFIETGLLVVDMFSKDLSSSVLAKENLAGSSRGLEVCRELAVRSYHGTVCGLQSFKVFFAVT